MRVLVASLAFLVLISAARAEKLSGVVLDADGQPAAGATISAAAIFRAPPLRLATVTDAEGGFRLELPKLSGSERYALAVRWQRQGADLTEALNAEGKEVAIAGQKLPALTIRLRNAGALRGKLLRAEDDGPIAGARLFLDTGEVLTTDAQGAFELPGLAMKEHSLIPVAAERDRQYVLFDTSLTPESELEIRLPRGTVLQGRILDEGGQPVREAYLTRSSSGTALTLNGWNEIAGDDGRYHYGGLSANRLFYGLTAQAPGYESHYLTCEFDDPTAVINRDIRLKKKAQKQGDDGSAASEADEESPGPAAAAAVLRRTIQGTVTDLDDKPIANAEIRWGSFQWDSSVKRAKTDAAGHYSLADVPGGGGAVFALADGYAPQFVGVKEGDQVADVRLDRGVTVRGKVTSTSGKPVASVRVIPRTTCMETGYCNPIWLSERDTGTNEAGEFLIEHMPALGTTFDFLKEGYSDERDVSLKPGEGGNEIKLKTGGALRGRVVDADGKPVRNFKVRVMIPRKRSPNEKVGGYYAGFDWYGVRFTRDDGVFVLSDVPADAWMRLIVTSSRAGVATVDRARTDQLDSLPPAADLTIKLKPFEALNVKVVSASTGEPMPAALVTLLEDEIGHTNFFNWGYSDLWAERRRTDNTGMAHFGTPACEDGTIIVRSPGHARTRLNWTNGNRNPEVRIERGATLQGEVLLGETLVTEGVVRLVSSQNDHIGVDLSETDGKFEFSELPAGECALSVSGEGNLVLDTRRIEVKPGETKTLKVRVTLPEKTEK